MLTHGIIFTCVTVSKPMSLSHGQVLCGDSLLKRCFVLLAMVAQVSGQVCPPCAVTYFRPTLHFQVPVPVPYVPTSWTKIVLNLLWRGGTRGQEKQKMNSKSAFLI